MRVGDIKVLLVLVTMLISIAVGEVAILVIGLVLSVYADEMRFQVLFKERRQLMGDIKEIQQLSKEQTDKIVALQQLNEKQTNEIKRQTREIGTLQQLSKEQTNEIKRQTREIGTLQQLSKEQTNEIKRQTSEIGTLQQLNKEQVEKIKRQTSEIVELQEVNEEQMDEIIKLRQQKDRNAILAVVLTLVGIVISIICCVSM